MAKTPGINPLAAAVGAAMVGSLATVSLANADDNPFGMTQLSSGYMVAEKAEGKCGEGKCGGDKGAKSEGKCGEGKCGEGKGAAKTGEGKCGEGKCGGDKGAKSEGQ